MKNNIRLLLVDDEESIRKKLTQWLQKRNYTVETAGTGESAVTKLESYPADVLITDLKMPGAGGITLIQQCREKRPDMGIIVITGHGDINTYIETSTMGVFEFLNKPFDPEDLHVIIKKLVQKQSS